MRYRYENIKQRVKHEDYRHTIEKVNQEKAQAEKNIKHLLKMP